MSVLQKVLRFPALTRSLVRPISTTPIRRSSAGYGDPQEEKINNDTPLSKGRDSGATATSGHATSGEQPNTGEANDSSIGSAGSGGGEHGSESKGGGGGEVSAKEIKETKKVGEEPKKEEVGGAGPIGG